mmetsp:Transcript_4669/g.8642  ORF Transcript_4669/g.8642 Transcript_4669/m.8642 type:complete len:227 (-) Transcript_4669:413-1093(-)
MYSLMSKRIMASSLSNMNSLRALQSSVLPTPVGPKNIKLAIGFEGSLSPALDLWIASVTAMTASSCPITLSPRIASIWRSLSLSLVRRLLTGIPVLELTMAAMSSAVTSSLRRSFEPSWSFPPESFSSCDLSFSSRAGSLLYLSSAAVFKSYVLSASAISTFKASISSRSWFTSPTRFLSDIHCASRFCCFTRRSSSSASIPAILPPPPLPPPSESLSRLSFSICS